MVIGKVTCALVKRDTSILCVQLIFLFRIRWGRRGLEDWFVCESERVRMRAI